MMPHPHRIAASAVSREKVGRIAYERLVDDHVRRLVIDAPSHVAETTA